MAIIAVIGPEILAPFSGPTPLLSKAFALVMVASSVLDDDDLGLKIKNSYPKPFQATQYGLANYVSNVFEALRRGHRAKKSLDPWGAPMFKHIPQILSCNLKLFLFCKPILLKAGVLFQCG